MAPGLHGAHAEVVTLTFEGAGNLARLNGFYGGGSDSQGHIGPDFGVVFGPTALSIIDEDVGTGNTGNFGNEPSPDTVLFFLTGPAVLNYSAGFSDGFSFFYSTTTFAAQVRVFDGLDAGGNLIGTIALRALGEGPGDPTGSFSNWEAAGLAFAGTARSIVFDGTADRVAFDNVTFGSATPTVTQTVAEPSTLALLGLALVGSAVVAGRRGRLAARD
jgi:hypothetical protein